MTLGQQPRHWKLPAILLKRREEAKSNDTVESVQEVVGTDDGNNHRGTSHSSTQLHKKQRSDKTKTNSDHNK